MSGISLQRLTEAVSFLTPEIRSSLAAAPNGSECRNLRLRQVALLACDISGFSQYTNQLLVARSDGAEVLHRELQVHYERLLEIILDNGGEPITFAGDGLLSVWDASDETLNLAVRRAALVARNLVDARLDGQGSFDLNVHVSCGDIRTAELGGANSRWLSASFGSSVTELRRIAATRKPNSVLMTQAAARLCGPDAQTRSLPGKTSHQLISIRDLPACAPTVLAVPDAEAWSSVLSRTPRYVSRWIERVGLEWIAELRPVTVMTLALPQFDETAPDATERLDTIVRTVQEIVHTHDGSAETVLADEKGAAVLAYFGTPPNAHADDPQRCVLSAVEAVARLGQMGVEAKIGVATGRAFCGIVGNSDCRSFLIVGDFINLSSRLAWIAAAGAGVLVDQQTYHATRDSIAYSPHPLSLSLRGHGAKISAWAISAGAPLADSAGTTAGRGAEVGMLRRLWAETVAGGEGLGVIIEGESATGKTNLALDLRHHIESDQGRFRISTAAATDRDTPFSALRRAITAELSILPGMTLAQRRSAILANLPEHLLDQAPLLEAIFPSGIADTAKTNELVGAARALAIETLLIEILKHMFGGRPACLCIDDAQWLDQASISLLLRLRTALPNLLLVILTQSTTAMDWLDDLVGEGLDRIRLQPLTREGLEELVMLKLGVQNVDPRLLDQLQRTAGGHPFFVAELVSSLCDSGHVRVADGRATLVTDAVGPMPTFPESLHGMVLQRLDYPEPEEQLSLRVASVAGLVFPTRIVSDIHPIQESRNRVHKHLLALSKMNIVEPRVAGDRPGYGFRLGIFHEVAYSQLPQVDRATLHGLAAQWIDANSGADRANNLQEMALHWSKSGQIPQAVDCLLEESLRLFRQGFAVEAVNVGLRAIGVSGIRTPDDSATRQAETAAAMANLQKRTQGWQPASFVAGLQPPAPELSIKVRALLSTAPFAFQSNQFEVFAWASSIAMQLVLDNQSGPPHAYSMFSIVIAALTGNRVTAATWSRAALDLDAATGGAALPAVGFIDTWFHSHWREPLAASVSRNEAAAARALADGDLQYASYNISGAVVMRAASGVPLDRILDAAREALTHPLHRNARVHALLEQQFARALRGETDDALSLTGGGVEEATDIAWVTKSEFVNQIGYYLSTRLRLHAYAGDRAGALALAEALAPLMPAIAGQTAEFDAVFHTVLSRLGLVLEGAVSPESQATAIALDMGKLQSWRAINSDNFGLKAKIVAAVQDGVTDDAVRAAAALAALAGDVPQGSGLSDKAVALEFAALLDPAAPHLAAAIAAYEEWGASAVAHRLAAGRP